MGGSTLHSRRILSARRGALLTTAVAALGASVLFVAPNFAGSPFASPVLAQNLTEKVQELPQKPVGFADIVEKVKPAVISVRVKIDQPAASSDGDDSGSPFPPGSPFEKFFKQFGMPSMPNGHEIITGQGSGFFISADGYAVTNNHVVQNAENVQVTTDDGKTYKAKVIGTDPRTDLALIKIDGNDFPYVKLSDTTPRVGDWVLAVGNPFGLGGTVTAGIVSARGRDIGAGPYDDFIQIDAPVNKGNSGGPTFDVDGNVIGVNTAIFSPSGGSVGIAFAIPANTVKSVIAQLRDKGTVTRGWIGVQIQSVTPDIADSMGLKQTTGALVSEPQKDSPAAKAGIASGDVITSVNGETVKDARDLARKIGTMLPGAAVKLGTIHDGSDKTVMLTLGTLPAEKEAANTSGHEDNSGSEVPKLGLTLAPSSKVSGSGGDGVVVTAVEQGGVAADHGFQVGDVILDVGGKAVMTPADVRKGLTDARSSGKHTVLFRVKSSDGTKFVALPLGDA
ncbi:MAG TPA: Do family serine endopeptidase [Xanthobacteraceae bacterium]|jgi:serine protease Do|nr:Do family serine endopeptidase [Xanthobacteraceae bacterium]